MHRPGCTTVIFPLPQYIAFSIAGVEKKNDLTLVLYLTWRRGLLHIVMAASVTVGTSKWNNLAPMGVMEVPDLAGRALVSKNFHTHERITVSPRIGEGPCYGEVRYNIVIFYRSMDPR